VAAFSLEECGGLVAEDAPRPLGTENGGAAGAGLLAADRSYTSWC